MGTGDSKSRVGANLWLAHRAAREVFSSRAREEYIERALQCRVWLKARIGPWVGIKPKQKGK